MLRRKCLIDIVQVHAATFDILKEGSVVSFIEDSRNKLRIGLSNARPDSSVERLADLLDHKPEAFIDILGGHCSSLTFEECLVRLPSPIYYVGTMGFAVWAPITLPLYSCYIQRGLNVFRCKESV